MARPLIPFVQNGYYASRNWIPLVKGNGFTTSGGGEQEEVWETASGSVVTFDAIAAPLRQLTVAVEPVQNGTGDPSPTNIRPITGWNSVTVNRTGKNLLRLTGRRIVTAGEYANANPRDFSEPSVYVGLTMNNYFNPNNVASYSIAEDGKSVSVNSRFTGYGIGFNVYVKPEEKYYFSYKDKEIAPKTIGFGFYDKDGYLLSFQQANTAANWAITTPENCYNMTVVFRPTQDETYTYEEPQLEVGTVETAYEPYQGNHYTIQLGQTIYGGTLDVTTGVVTVTWAKITLNGSEVWAGTPNSGWYTYASDLKKLTSYVGHMMADTLPAGAPGENRLYGYIDINNMYPGQNWIYYKNSTLASAAEVDAFFTANPTEVVYELATPFELTLTPEQISTLQGTNNVWSDAGDVTVEYRAQ